MNLRQTQWHMGHPIPFLFTKKTDKFWLRQTLCEPFADGAAHVSSPIHTYAHLVRMCVLALTSL